MGGKGFSQGTAPYIVENLSYQWVQVSKCALAVCGHLKKPSTHNNIYKHTCTHTHVRMYKVRASMHGWPRKIANSHMNWNDQTLMNWYWCTYVHRCTYYSVWQKTKHCNVAQRVVTLLDVYHGYMQCWLQCSGNTKVLNEQQLCCRRRGLVVDGSRDTSEPERMKSSHWGKHQTSTLPYQ